MLGVIRDCVHDNTTDADRFGGIYHAPCGVADQHAAKAAALISAINSEPREYNNRDWVGHITPETPQRCSNLDRTRSQGIIASDFVRIAHHECPRRAAGLIGKCAPFQPLIEGNDT